MKTIKSIPTTIIFCKDESGAVTVDWVVLTAAIVGLAIAAFTLIETQTSGLATDTGTVIGNRID